MQGRPGVGQIQSVSVLQSGEQPSPPVWLPSSHVSAGGSSTPFPHGLGLQLPGGPSQDTSVAPPMSGAPASRGLSTAASIAGGAAPACPPVPVVLLPEIPAHPATASVIRPADQRASRNPGQAFTSLIDVGRGRFGSTATGVRKI